MERRFEVRKRELLSECEISPVVFRGMMHRLFEFAEPFLARLWRREQVEHAKTYIAGLVSDLERKNVESIAYRYDQDRHRLQAFVGESPWNHEPLLEELARQVGQELGEADAVIVFDPSAFPKTGRDSVGVARQWCGRLGKVENCQVAVYMGYVSRKEHALVDERLYLPEDWAKDQKRRQKCGVPREVRFRTRHELSLAMLDARGYLLPHAWVAGDDEMGRSTWFRRELHARKERYLLAVPSNTIIRDLQAPAPPGGRGNPPQRPFEQVRKWAAALPPSAWRRIDVRDGSKGPLIMEMATTRVVAKTDRRRIGPEEVLVVTRVRDDAGTWKYDYRLSNARLDTPVEEFARVAKAEHRIEECIQRGKSEVGLADHEVRTWVGWHHHQTLSLIATWFLVQETRRGKKTHTSADDSPSTRGTGDASAPGQWLQQSQPDRTRPQAPTATHNHGQIPPLEKTQPVGALVC